MMVSDLREAFEKWYMGEVCCDQEELTAGDDGDYFLRVPSSVWPAWRAWQAALQSVENACRPQHVPEYWDSVIENLINYAWSRTCLHEETHRGGTIWEICSSCGEKWADDEGGKPLITVPKAIEDAEQMLNAAHSCAKSDGDL